MFKQISCAFEEIDDNHTVVVVSVNNSEKYHINTDEFDGTDIVDITSSTRIPSLLTVPGRKVFELSFSNIMDGLNTIVHKEEIDERYYRLSEKTPCTLRRCFDDMTEEYFWLFHDNQGHGMWLIPGGCYPSHLNESDMYYDALSDIQLSDCRYIVEHAQAPLSLQHYYMWKKLSSLWDALMSMSEEIKDGCNASWTCDFDDWKTVMVLARDMYKNHIDSIESLENILTTVQHPVMSDEMTLHV